MAEVQHDGDEKKFYVQSNGQEAHMTYRYQDESTVVYNHTYVPPELRGGGLAGKIVRTALEWARTENLKVKPTCSYVVAFVRRHPEYQDIAEL
ncbi:MAG: GNAT family N-acetyltransferase [bacterium]